MKIATLKTKHETYIARVREKGGNILPLTTPCCGGRMEVIAPDTAGDTWDSLTTCPDCGGMFFKIVRHDQATGHIPPVSIVAQGNGHV